MCRTCQVMGIGHDKDENSSENQKCFNRQWLIIILCKHLSIIWRSFKPHSQISSLATTQIIYSHHNLAYLKVEIKVNKKSTIKVLKQNKQQFYYILISACLFSHLSVTEITVNGFPAIHSSSRCVNIKERNWI